MKKGKPSRRQQLWYGKKEEPVPDVQIVEEEEKEETIPEEEDKSMSAEIIEREVASEKEVIINGASSTPTPQPRNENPTPQQPHKCSGNCQHHNQNERKFDRPTTTSVPPTKISNHDARLLYNRVGEGNHGVWIKVSRVSLDRYFKSFFGQRGFQNIKFLMKAEDKRLIMAFMFPKNSYASKGGKDSGNVMLNAIFGGGNSRSKYRLDEKFKNALLPFAMTGRNGEVRAQPDEKHRALLRVFLDPNKVFGHLYGSLNEFSYDIGSVYTRKKSAGGDVILDVIKTYKYVSSDDGNDIEKILEKAEL